MNEIVSEAEDFLDGVISGTEAIVKTVVDEAESVFKPRVGGKIDTLRKQKAAAERDAQLPVAKTDTLIQGKPVAVDSLLPEIGTAITVTLSANNVALPLLPQDSARRHATILAIDNDVYLSSDPGQAMTAANSAGSSAQGVAYLPKGIPVPWNSTEQLWVGATTSSVSRVTVLSAFKGA